MLCKAVRGGERNAFLESTDQLGFLVGDALNGDEEDGEEDGQNRKALCRASNYPVIPREDGQLIQSSDKIPARSDVAS